MKSLKFIALISVFTTPLAFAGTAISDQADPAADVSSEVYIELSTADILDNFPIGEGRNIPRETKVNLVTSLRTSLSKVQGGAKLRGLMMESPKVANTTSAAPHQINCAQAYNLSEDIVYTDTISSVGEQHCFVMPLSQKSKVVGQLLAADMASNFNLYLYQYDDTQGILAHVDSSENAAGIIEKAYAVLPKASYILVAELMSGAGGAFNLIGNSFSSYDNFEPNDSDITSKIPAITVGQIVTGNLDNPEDVDYFGYKLKSNETELKINVSGSAEHQVEIFNAGAWQVLPHDQLINANGSAGATYYIRTLAKPSTIPSALNNYKITTSNSFAKFADFDVWTTDRNLTDLVDYVHTEAFSNLSAGGKVVDSSGSPLVGEKMVVATVVNGEQIHKIVTTNALGKFSASFDLPKCSGDIITGTFDSNFGTPRNIWEIKYKAFS